MKINIPSFLRVRPWRDLAKGRDIAPWRAFVVNILSVMGLWKRCTASVPDFAVQLYRKVPHSTAKRVKKFRPESVVDYRKVITFKMIRRVDEAPKKRFCQNAPQNPAFEKVR
jgi:hypothetical protein